MDAEALQKYIIKWNKYYWKNLKSDVQCYIQQSQLKKLVPVKTKQPMMIDILGSSFDKIAMDIVGLLSKTEKRSEYI